jgi:hypothetical protein
LGQKLFQLGLEFGISLARFQYRELSLFRRSVKDRGENLFDPGPALGRHHEVA